MSWQLGSFVLVAVALGRGLWWYERTRPPATLVAVVATLAALAALGRDAFAALPDIKPTTAIVLIAGYTFGAPSGFAVGAFAALASNLELGQGPWTPWQMLAWGLVGVGGAVLARATGRRLGRRRPGRACALAAVGFEAIIDLYTWTGTGAHSLAGYGVVVAQAFTFSAAHVIASFAFGLAFGPALRAHAPARACTAGGALAPRRRLAAARARRPGRRRVRGARQRARAGGPGGGPGRRAGAGDRGRRRRGAARWPTCAAAQNADGGFGGSPGQSSSELYTAWVAMGLAAAGVDPASVRRDGHSVLDALRAGSAQLSGLGDDERTILALRAADAPIRSFPGPDLVTALLAGRARDGSFGDQVNTTAFAIFALRAAGIAPAAPAIRAGGTLAGRRAESRRRLQLRPAGGGQRQRRHRRRAPGHRRLARAPRCRASPARVGYLRRGRTRTGAGR